MTLGMLLLGIFWFFCGLLAHRLGESFGFFGYIVGFVCGAVAGYFVSWIVLVGRLRLFYPLPLCRRGNCQGYDAYHWPLRTVYGWEWWEIYRYRCNCEDGDYIRKGKQFLMFLPDGETAPFKKLTGFRKWTSAE